MQSALLNSVFISDNIKRVVHANTVTYNYIHALLRLLLQIFTCTRAQHAHEYYIVSACVHSIGMCVD